MKPPRLTFFCELEAGDLQTLFADPAVTDMLVSLQAGLAMGLIDLGDERAAVVRQLNQAGIPVTAWLLLPKEQGYWFNIDNAPQAAARYAWFKTWSKEHALRWEGIGIDIEPDFRELQLIISGEIQGLLPTLFRRTFDSARVLDGRLAYGALIREMSVDGFRVESYQFPFIADERKVNSTLLQRLFGILDLSVDREVFMLYSSFSRPYGPALLCSYAPDAGAIAIGSTGGGVDVPAPAPLAWQEFARDLLLAYRWSDDVFVFSLEGCVEQGFLEPLLAFDWEAPVAMPTDQIEQVNRLRAAFRGALWAGNHPFLVLLGTISALYLSKRVLSLLRK